eukprot:TRINITY_DN592_c0_g1_i1.p1 TRINITY_DN592_c0_g1~~TRINITY_DN592_c0_g1_i1.p1  ORF type:complete len:634 (+),score=149.18 TRINITY_DN592_c0_g1_i1:27-1904(+)
MAASSTGLYGETSVLSASALCASQAHTVSTRQLQSVFLSERRLGLGRTLSESGLSAPSSSSRVSQRSRVACASGLDQPWTYFSDDGREHSKSLPYAAAAAASTTSSIRPVGYKRDQLRQGFFVDDTLEEDEIVEEEEEEFRSQKWQQPTFQRKTKVVCTIGPTSNTREMIWKLAEAGMNVARLNMSHGDHASHLKVLQLVREHNEQPNANVIALLLDTKGPEVRSGDLPTPVTLERGEEFTFTIERGVSSECRVSVNYDGFIDDVDVDDIILVDGGMMSLKVLSMTHVDVHCVVVDGGELKSRRHLNVRGKSATLPSITEKDWDDIRFGVENKVDYYALSFVKDAQVIHQLKDYLKSQGADIKVLPKIESADSIPNLHAILDASDGAMVARGDLGAELPIEEVPLLQGEIIRMCRSMGKPVIVATNMLESMINHPTPTRAEVSDIAIAVREGADAVMLSGETAHGKYPLKAVRVMHTVALRTEATMPATQAPPNLGRVFKKHMSEMFAFHATMMSNTLGASILVFTRSGFMASLLSHYRPAGTTFAFTNDKRVQQRLALYHGVRALYMPFSSDAEDTYNQAITLLLRGGMVKVGEQVALVQSGKQPIWRSESTHHIQVRTVNSKY